MSRPSKANINLAALRQNYKLACNLAPQSKTIAVIKANAYGHGAVAIAQALADLAPAFAVACIEEAIELRDAGISNPILLLEGPFTAEEIPIASEQNFWLMASGAEQVEMIVRTRLSRRVRVWLKIDSGMHRLGISDEAFAAKYGALTACNHVESEVVLASHFACADDINSKTTENQIRLFDKITKDCEASVSLANSAGLLHWSSARRDWNRVGIMLYGASPFAGSHPNGDRLRAVMTFNSGIIGIRDVAEGETVGYADRWIAPRASRIATIAVGYGDGYPRSAVDGTPVLVNGHRAVLAGRVSMDMITVDVTDLPAANVGDPVELWGENLPLNEVAGFADTISYELVTRMPLRVPRVYRH